jgi:SARP family transcriptional regulator, regulator of embCAB operon
LAKRWRADETVRVYLCGSVAIERADRLVRDGGFGGRQGRLLFAFLMTRAPNPVPKAELVRALWAASPPPSADTALNAVISKLRRVLRTVGIADPDGIWSDVGTYRLTLPAAWIDLETARAAADRAEGALRREHLGAAWADANVAATIARQPFLPDETRGWVVRQREILSHVWRRALLVLSEVSTRNREYELGIQHAAEVAAAEPFDELACQALMRAHAAAGNRAEALRVYAKCRKLFRDELGAEPTEKTAAVFLSILKSTA